MQCPTCPSLLAELKVGAIALDECPRCLGMWFDKGELTQFLSAQLATKTLQQRFVPPERTAGGTAHAACPRCIIARLAPVEEDGVTLDGCGRCGGRWLPAALVSALLSAKPANDDTSAPPPAPAPIESAPSVPVSSALPIAMEAPAPAPAAIAGPPVLQSAPAADVVQGCAACGAKMEPASHAGQSFHRCSKCEALFFPRGGLPFFLGNQPRSYPLPSGAGLEPRESAPCPACTQPMNPMTLSGQPVRVYACVDCWSMFASNAGVRRLVAPEVTMDDQLQGPLLGLYRMLDAFTEWLVNPPKSNRWTVHKR